MTMTVTSIGAVQPTLPTEGALPERATSAEPTSGSSFAQVFGKVVTDANRADQVATDKVEALARGASDDIHGTMIAVKEADISIKLVGTMRNKLLDAFTELWRTSV
jgi:flagellar hook-basal body complex protein FliE